MSVSKPMYDPKMCDGQPCPGDCDLCSRWQLWEDDETDLFDTGYFRPDEYEDLNDAEKRKGTPAGAPIDQIDFSTPGSKTQWLADILFSMIEDDELMGRPIKRPLNRSVDRTFRKKVEKANREGDCIINLGDGYFRPDRHDESDEWAYRLYRAKELKRAKSIIDKITSMDKAFYRR